MNQSVNQVTQVYHSSHEHCAVLHTKFTLELHQTLEFRLNTKSNIDLNINFTTRNVLFFGYKAIILGQHRPSNNYI